MLLHTASAEPGEEGEEERGEREKMGEKVRRDEEGGRKGRKGEGEGEKGGGRKKGVHIKGSLSPFLYIMSV